MEVNIGKIASRRLRSIEKRILRFTERNSQIRVLKHVLNSAQSLTQLVFICLWSARYQFKWSWLESRLLFSLSFSLSLSLSLSLPHYLLILSFTRTFTTTHTQELLIPHTTATSLKRVTDISNEYCFVKLSVLVNAHL